jgi:cytochrome c5
LILLYTIYEYRYLNATYINLIEYILIVIRGQTMSLKLSKQFLLSLLTVSALTITGCSDKETAPEQEVAATPEPAPQVAEPAQSEPAMAEPEPEPVEVAQPAAAARDGQTVYKTACFACHDAGVAGAPKLGDKAAWAPRIAKGNDALYSTLQNGLNAMPPKGTCMNCSDDELKAVLDYMIEQGS